jgi:hypothetical protein
MNQMKRLEIISVAIWLRDHAKTASNQELLDKCQHLSSFGIFSNRNLTRLISGRLSHATIGRHTHKTTRNGGSIAPDSLEDIRDALFSKEGKVVDYEAVVRALKKGTSQNMVTKLTGISQSSISRRINNAS